MRSVRNVAEVRRLGRRLIPIAALALGSAPGLLLPFFVTLRMDRAAGDEFALGLSAANVLLNVFSSTFEAALLASFGRQRAEGSFPTALDFRSAHRRGFRLCAPPIIVIFPLLLALYAASSGRYSFLELVLAAFPLFVYPVVAAQSAIESAALVAHGHLTSAFASLSLRGLPPIIVLCTPISNIAWLVALGLVLGEMARWSWLAAARSRLLAHQHAEGELHRLSLPNWSSWLHQTVSMSLSQLTTVLNRGFLANTGAGNVVRGDSAEKVLFAANQLLMSGLILPEVARMPVEARNHQVRHLQSVVRKRSALIFAVALLVALAMSLILITLQALVPALGNSRVGEALQWAQILIFAAPFVALNFWGSRLIILAGMTRVLPAIAASTVVVTLASNLCLVPILGGLGVIVASVLSYTVAGLAVTGITFRFFATSYIATLSRPSELLPTAAND